MFFVPMLVFVQMARPHGYLPLAQICSMAFVGQDICAIEYFIELTRAAL